VIDAWFAERGWTPRRHQLDMLRTARAGRSVLAGGGNGAGKTLGRLPAQPVRAGGDRPEGLHTLYISPLKALAVDVQRNLLGPVEEMGLPIKIETRTGDTPSDRKARQRASPPHMLLTTPESLSLLLSHADSPLLFAGLKMVVVDEIHAFATQKRGDLLALALSRLEKLAPGLRRVGLSATVADPDAYRAWLAPHGDMDAVELVRGDPGAEPNIAIMLPEDQRVPWSGHSGRWAAHQV
jgi:ATP-dependent Lhr-like helicase